MRKASRALTATRHYGRDAFDRADLWDKRCKGSSATDSHGRPIEIVKDLKARG